MKNVTIEIDDRIGRRARVAAAESGRSLSSWVCQNLRRQLGEAASAPPAPLSPSPATEAQIAALRVFLDGPGWPGIADNLPSRDELHDRPALRRHEPPRLRPRSDASRKAKDGA